MQASANLPMTNLNPVIRYQQPAERQADETAEQYYVRQSLLVETRLTELKMIAERLQQLTFEQRRQLFKVVNEGFNMLSLFTWLTQTYPRTEKAMMQYGNYLKIMHDLLLKPQIANNEEKAHSNNNSDTTQQVDNRYTQLEEIASKIAARLTPTDKEKLTAANCRFVGNCIFALGILLLVSAFILVTPAGAAALSLSLNTAHTLGFGVLLGPGFGAAVSGGLIADIGASRLAKTDTARYIQKTITPTALKEHEKNRSRGTTKPFSRFLNHRLGAHSGFEVGFGQIA